MDKVRVQKLCLAVFAVSVALILLTTVVNWIGGAVIDEAFAELGEDDYGLISYAKGETVKLVRSVLTGGTLSLFTSIDSLAGGSEISSLVPMMDDWFSSMIREMVKENLNPFAYFLLNVWAYMPHIRDVAYISCALSAVIWYVMGGRFDTLKDMIASFGTAFTTIGPSGVEKTGGVGTRTVYRASDGTTAGDSKGSGKTSPEITKTEWTGTFKAGGEMPGGILVDGWVDPDVLSDKKRTGSTFVTPVKSWACACGHTNPEEKEYCMKCRKNRYAASATTVSFMSAPSDDDLAKG